MARSPVRSLAYAIGKRTVRGEIRTVHTIGRSGNDVVVADVRRQLTWLAFAAAGSGLAL
jgi:hypothetical protein